MDEHSIDDIDLYPLGFGDNFSQNSDDEIITDAIRSEQREWIDFDDDELSGQDDEDGGWDEVSSQQITNRGLLAHVAYSSENKSVALDNSLVLLSSGLTVVIHCKVRRKSLGRKAHPEAPKHGGLYIGMYAEIVDPSGKTLSIAPGSRCSPLTGGILPEGFQCWLIEPWLGIAYFYRDEIDMTLADSVLPRSYAGHYSQLAKGTKPQKDPYSLLNFLVTNARMSCHLSAGDILSIICSFKFGDRFYYSTLVPLLSINMGGEWAPWLQQVVLNEHGVQFITLNEPIIGTTPCVACGLSRAVQYVVRLDDTELLMGSKCFARIALAREIAQYFLQAVANRHPLDFRTLVAFETRTVPLL